MQHRVIYLEIQKLMKNNYYQILEVEQNASAEKIREQYLFLVQAWHPDKFSKTDQKASAEEKVKEINTAYDVLRDPARRAEYDQKLQSSKKSDKKQQPASQAGPHPAPVPPIMKKRSRSKGLFGSLGVYGRQTATDDRVRVFINGRGYYLGVDELVGARVQYFLNGESKGIVDFRSLQHIRAAVNQVAGPNGYEIHVLRLAPYGSRPGQVFTPLVQKPRSK